MASLPYIAPFLLFFVYLTLGPLLGLSSFAFQAGFVAFLAIAIVAFSRPVLDFRVCHAVPSLLLGVATFLIWIGPEALIPGYRDHWLFHNSITGEVGAGGLGPADRTNTAILLLRGIRASLLVPILEELFWRAWLMRWLIKADFQKVPLGAWSPQAFWVTALAFGAEHGPYWEVGLVTGILWNGWMVRTKSLGDLILVHAVTNFCLSLYVVFAGQWHYWG